MPALADPETRSPARSWRLRLIFGLPWIGLASVALAWTAGVSGSRLSALTIELGASATGTLFLSTIRRASARRARRQRATDLPWGVRLTKPLWMRAEEPAVAVALGGLLAALPAAFGLRSVSIGVFLTLALVGAALFLFAGTLTPSGLTFEQRGLWAHLMGVSFLVPWDAVARVEVAGPDHRPFLTLHIRDQEPVLASVQPATARARRRAEMALSAGKRPRGMLVMLPWTAGVDGTALERAIEKGRSGAVAPAALN